MSSILPHSHDLVLNFLVMAKVSALRFAVICKVTTKPTNKWDSSINMEKSNEKLLQNDRQIVT